MEEQDVFAPTSYLQTLPLEVACEYIRYIRDLGTLIANLQGPMGPYLEGCVQYVESDGDYYLASLSQLKNSFPRLREIGEGVIIEINTERDFQLLKEVKVNREHIDMDVKVEVNTMILSDIIYGALTMNIIVPSANFGSTLLAGILGRRVPKIGLTEESQVSLADMIGPLPDFRMLIRRDNGYGLVTYKKEDLVDNSKIQSLSISMPLAVSVTSVMSSNYYDTFVRILSPEYIGGKYPVPFNGSRYIMKSSYYHSFVRTLSKMGGVGGEIFKELSNTAVLKDFQIAQLLVSYLYVSNRIVNVGSTYEIRLPSTIRSKLLGDGMTTSEVDLSFQEGDLTAVGSFLSKVIEMMTISIVDPLTMEDCFEIPLDCKITGEADLVSVFGRMTKRNVTSVNMSLISTTFAPFIGQVTTLSVTLPGGLRVPSGRPPIGFGQTPSVYVISSQRLANMPGAMTIPRVGQLTSGVDISKLLNSVGRRGYRRSELVAMAKSMGLKTSGTKSVLVERIMTQLDT